MRPPVIILLVVLSALTAVMPSKAANDTRPAVQQALRALIDTGAVGVQARVHDASGTWTAGTGTAVLGSSRPVPTDGRVRVDGVTVTFTAVVVLQLVQEGRVGLDDPVQRHLPGLLPHGDKITVRMLLQQTSGLHNYEDEVPDRGIEFLRVRFRDHAPRELVALSTAKPLSFDPGSKWEYSSTNFIVAGLLIEELTGHPYRIEVARRILTPLGLDQTVLPGHSPFLPGPHARGYLPVDLGGHRIDVDVTEQNPSFWYAAGEIISTTRDLDNFVRALTAGALISPELFAEMTRTVPADHSEYGLGLLTWQLPCGRVAIGHDGRLPGFRTFMASTLNGDRRVQFSENTRMVEPTPAHWLAEFRVITSALCG